MNLKIIDKKIWYSIFLVFILAISRIIPHPPNFTPVISIVILGGILFRSFFLCMIVFILAMLISDLLIGLHHNMIYIYLTLIFIGYIFFNFANKTNLKNLWIFSLAGSTIFFIITNFFVWLNSGLYEKNIEGILSCYTMALPFFTNTIFSTLFFSYLTYIAINYFNNDFKFIFKN